eukprot:TRINITY_DN558_c0_g1_i2.p1 TRINITY_DN558_c0_g1~~TRINITY_DN558_c0_g1_i2.p1  ORF type:complete len:600 (+),score=203.61 TRINITY_DN558_c0_g1_i2:154-1800(+)
MPSGYQSDSYGQGSCTNATSTECCCSTLKKGSSSVDCIDVEKLTCFVKAQKTTSASKAGTKASALRADGTQLWIILCGALVFFMQCGFAMLEVGAVRTHNTLNIIFKNLMDACLGAVFFYSFGYAFAYGSNDAGHFVGSNNFFLMYENDDESGMYLFFFQFAFAATASTIVSGAVAERTKIIAYFIYAVVITGFVYPVVVHWVWSPHGWLSFFASREERIGPNGMIDFAGSGVVHIVGGFAGLCGSIVLGPRYGRFEELEEDPPADDDGERPNTRGMCNMGRYGAPQELRGQSMMLAALGVLILWFGWYGFNCGSTLAYDGENAGKVAVTTTLSAASAGVSAVSVVRVLRGHWAVDHGLNGVLAGLVSVTAGCSVVDEWAAIVIGLIGGVVYFGASELLEMLKVDDPLSAWPVHGACGVWGCLAVGIFAQGRNIERAYSASDPDLDAVARGAQFAIQLCGVVAIVGWTVGCCLPMFMLIDKTIGMRVSLAVEDKGLDVADHGMDPTRSFQFREAARQQAAAQEQSLPYGKQEGEAAAAAAAEEEQQSK